MSLLNRFKIFPISPNPLISGMALTGPGTVHGGPRKRAVPYYAASKSRSSGTSRPSPKGAPKPNVIGLDTGPSDNSAMMRIHFPSLSRTREDRWTSLAAPSAALPLLGGGRQFFTQLDWVRLHRSRADQKSPST